MTPYHRDSLEPTSRDNKTVVLLAETKINLHSAVSDEPKGTAIREQILLDSFMSR